MMMSKSLPYDAEIEYLQGDGSAYLNLEFPTHILGETNWALEFSIPDNKTYVFAGANQYQCQFVIANRCFRFDIATAAASPTSGALSYDTFYSLVKQNNAISIGNISKTITRTSWSSQSFYLFSKNPKETNTIFKGRVASFVITSMENGNTLYHFIPVRIGQVGYMYDKVSGQLFGNQGTGDFVLGADKA